MMRMIGIVTVRSGSRLLLLLWMMMMMMTERMLLLLLLLLPATHHEQRIAFVHSRLVDEIVIILHNQSVDVVGSGQGRVLLVDC